jgi:anti-sigma factor (TIGR02949 family)
MTCEEAIDRLAEYLDSGLDRETVTALGAHLGRCAPCRAYLATYRQTRALAARANRVEIPESVRARLRRLLGR